MRTRFLAALALTLLPTLALAHPGDHDHASFLAGLLHPLTGLDHLLAMVAAGLLAGRLGRTARWLVPVAFVSMMAAGALVSTTGFELPATELMIIASVAAFGLAVSAPKTLGTVAATALVAFFALFHGYAHGAEAGAANIAPFVAGFCVSTALLLVTGIAAASLTRRAPSATMLRVFGRIMLIASVALVIRMI
jgi:urease accessory protein